MDAFVVLLAVALLRERRAEASARARAIAQTFADGEGNAAQIEQVIRHFAVPVAVS